MSPSKSYFVIGNYMHMDKNAVHSGNLEKKIKLAVTYQWQGSLKLGWRRGEC